MRFFAMAVVLLVAATPLVAQVPTAVDAQPQYRTGGIVLGLGFLGSTTSVNEGEDYDSGGGLSFRLGYGFTDNLSVFLQGTASSMSVTGYSSESYMLSQGDLGLRYLFVRGSRIVPYAQAAVAARQFEYDLGAFGDLQARGSAFSVGGGGEIFLAQTLAVDVGLDFSRGRYTEGRLGRGAWERFGTDSFSSNSVRLGVGLLWRP